MSLTYAQLHAIVEEVDALTVPSGVQKVFERDAEAFVLQLRGRGATRYVIFDTAAGRARLHLVDGKPTQPERPSSFVMLLRKHLVGTSLQAVELAEHDRVVTLRFVRRIEDVETPVELIAELFGRHPTVGVLVGGLVVGQQDPRGRLELGAPYSPPAGVASALEADELQLAELTIGTRSARVAEHFADVEDDAMRGGLRQVLTRALTAQSKRKRRLVRNLERDLERAEAAQDYRRLGELLQSAYSLNVPRGAKSVMVPDYYAPDSPLVEVALDPSRSLKANIARYFHEYRRMSAALVAITERLLAAMEAVEQLEDARRALDVAADDELEALDQAWRAAEILGRPSRAQGRRPRNAPPPPPYRTFIGRSGAKILVGRGAKHNDALSTKVARGRDVWLHARDWAGAHVLIRMEKDGEPDGEDLRDAALLAVHFSKGRADSLVDVTHTRAKWVRKPKGAAPGLVTVAGGSTLAVAPDEERLAQLFATEVVER